LLRLTSRHYHLINGIFSMRYQRRATHAEVLFSPVVAMPTETLEFMLETIAVSVYHQSDMVLGPGRPRYDIRLSMAAPPHLARYAELSAARFHFDPGAGAGRAGRGRGLGTLPDDDAARGPGPPHAGGHRPPPRGLAAHHRPPAQEGEAA